MNEKEFEIKLKRLERKLAQKDIKIDGLNKKISQLERKVSYCTIDLSRTIESSIQHVLSNVRMIPVLGIGSNSKIVEIKTEDVPRFKR